MQKSIIKHLIRQQNVIAQRHFLVFLINPRQHTSSKLSIVLFASTCAQSLRKTIMRYCYRCTVYLYCVSVYILTLCMVHTKNSTNCDFLNECTHISNKVLCHDILRRIISKHPRLLFESFNEFETINVETIQNTHSLELRSSMLMHVHILQINANCQLFS